MQIYLNQNISIATQNKIIQQTYIPIYILTVFVLIIDTRYIKLKILIKIQKYYFSGVAKNKKLAYFP